MRFGADRQQPDKTAGQVVGFGVQIVVDDLDEAPAELVTSAMEQEEVAMDIMPQTQNANQESSTAGDTSTESDGTSTEPLFAAMHMLANIMEGTDVLNYQAACVAPASMTLIGNASAVAVSSNPGHVLPAMEITTVLHLETESLDPSAPHVLKDTTTQCQTESDTVYVYPSNDHNASGHQLIMQPLAVEEISGTRVMLNMTAYAPASRGGLPGVILGFAADTPEIQHADSMPAGQQTSDSTDLSGRVAISTLNSIAGVPAVLAPGFSEPDAGEVDGVVAEADGSVKTVAGLLQQSLTLAGEVTRHAQQQATSAVLSIFDCTMHGLARTTNWVANNSLHLAAWWLWAVCVVMAAWAGLVWLCWPIWCQLPATASCILHQCASQQQQPYLTSS
eukprot:jgi/Chrzof1/12761/Cz07g06170.t1